MTTPKFRQNLLPVLWTLVFPFGTISGTSQSDKNPETRTIKQDQLTCLNQNCGPHEEMNWTVVSPTLILLPSQPIYHRLLFAAALLCCIAQRDHHPCQILHRTFLGGLSVLAVVSFPLILSSMWSHIRSP